MDVLVEGLARLLPAIAQIPGVTRSGIGTMIVSHEGRVGAGLAPDAAGVELLEPSPR